MMEAAAAVSEDRHRLQRHMDGVDLAAPPRIELTYGSTDEGPASLAVLDSSFNPPTRAHLHLLSVAAERLHLSHSMLLLAKQNADKPVVGASLVQRLEMMELIARAASPAGSTLCGVTAHPLFVDKAYALRALCSPDTRIAVLVGYDTWIRIVDPKYYKEGGLEPALMKIFDAVEVIVASRDSSSASGVGPLSAAEQEAVVQQLDERVTRSRLHFLHNDPTMAPLSSSAIRKAIAAEEQQHEPQPPHAHASESTPRRDGGSNSGSGPGVLPEGEGQAALPAPVREMLPECLHTYVEAQQLYREG